MGFLCFICFQFMIKNTVIRVDTTVKLNEEHPKFNVWKALVNFAKNRPAVGATIAAMGMFTGMQGAATAVSVVFQIYFKNPQISGIVQLFAMIPIVLFTPLARKMVTKYGKKELSVIGSICSIIGGLGYVNNAVAANVVETIDVTLLSWDVAVKLRVLVAVLFLASALMQFIGLALIYNLDKKTLAKMNKELGRNVEAE